MSTLTIVQTEQTEETTETTESLDCQPIESGDILQLQGLHDCVEISDADQQQYVLRVKGEIDTNIDDLTECGFTINGETIESLRYNTQYGEVVVISQTVQNDNRQVVSIQCGEMVIPVVEVGLFDDILMFGEDKSLSIAANQYVHLLFAPSEQAPQIDVMDLIDSQFETDVPDETDSVQTRLPEADAPLPLDFDTSTVTEPPVIYDNYDDGYNGYFGTFNGLLDYFEDYFGARGGEVEVMMYSDPSLAIEFTWNYDVVDPYDIGVQAWAVDTFGSEPFDFTLEDDMQSAITYVPECCDYALLVENYGGEQLEITFHSSPEITVDEFDEVMVFAPEEEPATDYWFDWDDWYGSSSSDSDEDVSSSSYSPIQSDMAVTSDFQRAVERAASMSTRAPSTDSVEAVLSDSSESSASLQNIWIVFASASILGIVMLFVMAKLLFVKYKARKMQIIRKMQTAELSDEESVGRQYHIMDDNEPFVPTAI